MSKSSEEPTRVLLVDDEPAILRSLSREFLEHGFAVETTGCVAEAKVMLHRAKIDAIVCDHRMPGQTGLEFLTDLRKRNPDIIAILLSGQIEGLAVAESWASEIGLHATFAKPFDACEIAETITSLLKSDDDEPTPE